MPYMGRETLREKLMELRHLSCSNQLPDVGSHLGNSELGELDVVLESEDRLTAPYVVWSDQNSLERGLNYCIEIADALSYSHNERVLHLDLKPSNVIVTEDDQALLFDFNLSRDALHKQYPTGGTMAYMSPEQIQRVVLSDDSVHIDHRSDIFSLGVMLFEIFLGRLPFFGLGEPLQTMI